jgi:hypothetical protein
MDSRIDHPSAQMMLSVTVGPPGSANAVPTRHDASLTCTVATSRACAERPPTPRCARCRRESCVRLGSQRRSNVFEPTVSARIGPKPCRSVSLGVGSRNHRSTTLLGLVATAGGRVALVLVGGEPVGAP